MNEFVKILLSLSVSGALLLLLILGLKPLYKNRFSKSWQYYIWIIVALRFLFPFTPDTAIVARLFESFDTATITNEINISFNAPISVNTDNSEREPVQTNEGITDSAIHKPFDICIGVLFIWSAGAMVLFVRKVTVYQGFIHYIKAGNTEVSDIEILNLLSDCEEKLKIKTRVELFRNPLVASPIMTGFFRQGIVLPDCKLEEKQLTYILVHELIHCRQRDMLYKWLIQVVVCVHWFNPLVYVLEKEVNKYCELSCDEKVISMLDEKARREYGDMLISFLKSGNLYKSSLASVTLTEEAKQLKERLGAIMEFNKKNKAIRFLTGVITVCIIFVAAFIGSYRGADASMLANQKQRNQHESQSNTNNYADSGLPEVQGLPELEEIEPLVDDKWPISISRITENTTAKNLSFDFQVDEPMVIEVSCVTESGKISMEIRDTNGNKLFDETNMKTETFEVNIDEAGNYTVIIQAKNHTGSFRIAPKSASVSIVHESAEVLYYENGSPYIHDIITNNTDKSIVETEYCMLAYDEKGSALKLNWRFLDSSTESSYENLVRTKTSILPYRTEEYHGGWSLYDGDRMENLPKTKTGETAQVAYPLFCLKQVSFEDGTVWNNPDYENWFNAYAGKNADVAKLQNYYPYKYEIKFN